MTAINARVRKNRSAGDGEEMNKANIFTGHIGTRRFKALGGTHCWVPGRPEESASAQDDSQI